MCISLQFFVSRQGQLIISTTRSKLQSRSTNFQISAARLGDDVARLIVQDVNAICSKVFFLHGFCRSHGQGAEIPDVSFFLTAQAVGDLHHAPKRQGGHTSEAYLRLCLWAG